MDEVLHSVLQAPPLELDGDKFVGAHPWAAGVVHQLLLRAEPQMNKSLSPAHVFWKERQDSSDLQHMSQLQTRRRWKTCSTSHSDRLLNFHPIKR